MPPHAPKRIYSPQALESWFAKLEADWAVHFSGNQLELGRHIYRNGEVRELELTDNTAIIHRRVEKHDEYSVIDWENATFAVRSTAAETDAARALAVAGLYEIEELICDEIPPLATTTARPAPINASTPAPAAAPQKTDISQNAAAPANTSWQTFPATPSDAAASSSNGAAPLSHTPAQPARSLLIRFVTKRDGLSFQAFWKNSDHTRIPALGGAGTAGVTGAERTKLIGLAAYARKAHFTYDQKTSVYLLPAITEIPAFLKSTLPQWRRLFLVELDAHAAKLLNAPCVIEIGAIASQLHRNNKSPATFSSAYSGDHTSDSTIDLRWIFKAGEHLLTEDEIAHITKHSGSPVLIPEIGIVTLPADRLETLKNWQRNIVQTRSADGTLPPYLVFSLFNDARLKLTLSPEIEAWRQSVLTPPVPPTSSRPVEAGTPAPEQSLPLPEILRPYQLRGVEWLAHLCSTGCHGLLADEMGLGKTLQTIALITARPAGHRAWTSPSAPGTPVTDTQAGAAASPSEPRSSHLPPHTLIVCPASVVPVWQDEFAKFSPGTRVEILKTGNDFSAQPTAAGTVWISSYAQLRKHRALLDTTRFGYAVLDEGQFIKNPDAKTTQACFAIRAEHRIVLTGTPLENRQLDLWSIFHFLLPGLLGTRTGFEASLAVDRDNTIARLRAQVAPFILRRTKSEVASELPPKIEMDINCPLTPVQRAEYARVCAEGLKRLGDDMGTALRERSFGFLALLTRLRQICCDPDMLPWLNTPLSDSGKISLLVEKLSEVISGGHKVVIFSQFVMLLERVHEALALAFPEVPRYEITGMTKDRLKPVQSFQTTKGSALMLVSLKAGGTGITLHAADYVFLLDPWWNPAVEAQAIDRVHRIGQANKVFVYRMVTSGTIEERIQTLKESKRGLFEQIVGGLGGDVDLSQHFQSMRELVQLTSAEIVEAEQTPALATV